jgi:hypothetical protein
MIKKIAALSATIGAVIAVSHLGGCTQKKEDNVQHNNEKILNYKPGIGFFMGRIQAYHEKLGLSLDAQNKELADFYIHELEHNIEDMQELHEGRQEIQLMNMLTPAIEAIESALDSTNFVKAKEGYLQLTNSCNACHNSLEFDYIVIKEPNANHYTNQDFTSKNL